MRIVDNRVSLSALSIDIDKDWGGRSIFNLSQLKIGDIIFSNGWRLTEIENGIALVNDKGEIIKRWTNA